MNRILSLILTLTINCAYADGIRINPDGTPHTGGSSGSSQGNNNGNNSGSGSNGGNGETPKPAQTPITSLPYEKGHKCKYAYAIKNDKAWKAFLKLNQSNVPGRDFRGCVFNGLTFDGIYMAHSNLAGAIISNPKGGRLHVNIVGANIDQLRVTGVKNKKRGTYGKSWLDLSETHASTVSFSGDIIHLVANNTKWAHVRFNGAFVHEMEATRSTWFDIIATDTNFEGGWANRSHWVGLELNRVAFLYTDRKNGRAGWEGHYFFSQPNSIVTLNTWNNVNITGLMSKPENHAVYTYYCIQGKSIIQYERDKQGKAGDANVTKEMVAKDRKWNQSCPSKW